jgi:hypothetical protein
VFRNFFADQWFYPAAVIFLLAGSAFAIVVGLGLMLRSGAMVRFFALMNHWVSTREMMKSAERSRDIDTVLHRQTGFLGVVIVVCAGVSLWLLLRSYDVNAIVGALRDRASPVLVEMVARAAKWILVVGHVMSIAVGIALIFFPAAIAKLESGANQWFSFRKQGRDLDMMHMTLDQWVESYPRAVGFCIVALALFVIVSLGGTFLSRA